MTPLWGWRPRGERLPGRAPHGHWRALTFIAALRADRIDAPCVFNGPINGEAFTAYVEQVLTPPLAPGDVLIIDNLGSHKGRAVCAAIRKAGAHLIFLPPYSPDLNPIGYGRHRPDPRSPSPPNECANHFVDSGYASI